jgi:hypothetical protein
LSRRVEEAAVDWGKEVITIREDLVMLKGVGA